MHSPDIISALISEIYEGVIEPERWNNALKQFVNLSGARFAFLAVIDGSTGTLPVSSVVGPETSNLADALDLHRELVPIDPGVPYALARPGGGNFRFRDTSKALTQEPDAWRDFIRHDLGSGDYHSRFSAEQDDVSMVLALHTPADRISLTPEQERLHALVFDHLQRASRLAYRPPDLRMIRRPAIMVDDKGQILDANRLAETILSVGDGLTVARGRLRASDQSVDQTLRLLIHKTCRGNHEGRAEPYCVVRRPSGKRDYLLRLGPLPMPNLVMATPAYRCIIEILGLAEQQPDPEHLASLYGLTPREAEIASLLASSFNNLRSIAVHLGISHETARVHVRSIFSKLGVGNQVELVRVLAQLQ